MGKRVVGVNEAGLRVGQDHQNARYTDGEVRQVHELRDEGLSYNRIAEIMEMPKATVASICSGRRRCQSAVAWRTVCVPG